MAGFPWPRTGSFEYIFYIWGIIIETWHFYFFKLWRSLGEVMQMTWKGFCGLNTQIIGWNYLLFLTKNITKIIVLHPTGSQTKQYTYFFFLDFSVKEIIQLSCKVKQVRKVISFEHFPSLWVSPYNTQADPMTNHILESLLISAF